MEAAIATSWLPASGCSFVINGQFGERFKAICESFGAVVDNRRRRMGRGGLTPTSSPDGARRAKTDYRAGLRHPQREPPPEWWRDIGRRSATPSKIARHCWWLDSCQRPRRHGAPPGRLASRHRRHSFPEGADVPTRRSALASLSAKAWDVVKPR